MIEFPAHGIFAPLGTAEGFAVGTILLGQPVTCLADKARDALVLDNTFPVERVELIGVQDEGIIGFLPGADHLCTGRQY